MNSFIKLIISYSKDIENVTKRKKNPKNISTKILIGNIFNTDNNEKCLLMLKISILNNFLRAMWRLKTEVAAENSPLPSKE